MNNTFYSPNDYRRYLEHFGVKGMKWGVRRYRDYDGSYTQAGVKRYNITERRYDDMASKAKQAKADYKAGKITKLEYNQAKSARRDAERDLKKDFARLRNDKLADQGKRMYANNQRITSNIAAPARIWLAKEIAASILANSGHIDAATAVSGAGNILAVGKAVSNVHSNRRLRAYYGHGGNWSGWAQKNAKYIKQYGGKG